jgi:hypothetical protein
MGFILSKIIMKYITGDGHGKTVKELKNTFIVTYIKQKLEKYLKDIMFIMLMVILIIIRLKIYLYLQLKNICNIIILKSLRKERIILLMFYCTKLKEKLLNGTKALLAKNGIKNMLKTWDLGKILIGASSIVFSAVEVLLKQDLIKNFAVKIVRQNIDDYPVLTMKVGSVVFVKQNSNVTGIASRPIVVKNVHTSKEQDREVYDLTIEQCPEFYANGVLVHNCSDTKRYFLCEYFKNEYRRYIDRRSVNKYSGRNYIIGDDFNDKKY